MDKSDLELFVYDGTALAADCPAPLPGLRLINVLHWSTLLGLDADNLEVALATACRKLAMMWEATVRARETEQEFYRKALQDSPALWGQNQVVLVYHLEAAVMFGRSALDIASKVFSQTLPPPFAAKRLDSLNDLLKRYLAGDSIGPLRDHIEHLRTSPDSWLPIVAHLDKGHGLRDKLAHQMEFPISYQELSPPSEKERPVVRLGDALVPLETFLAMLRDGVLDLFGRLEAEAAHHLENFLSKEP